MYKYFYPQSFFILQNTIKIAQRHPRELSSCIENMHYLNLIFTSNIYGGFKRLMTESKYKEESYASIKTKKILNGSFKKLLK